MKSIAVTGTIGSGKSACSSYLREKGCEVFDCDAQCRSYLNKDGLLYEQVIQLLGAEILTADGSVDRKKVAELIFQDTSLKSVYEKMFHEQLKEQLLERIKKNTGLFFAEVPILYETGFDELFDEVWLVWCDEDTAISRCITNRGMKKEEVLQRIRAQMSVEEKKQRADVLFENNGALSQLHDKIDVVLKELKQDGMLWKESVSD
ncbi:MAG: dephospho-CoA kinase [Erysipelotrichaceae bacterium]|nr:dephospho-CoA kinase [Erysipelotrichaceae bacterium]MBQ7890229.1 dephospho-CoA kinase [Erysipelotrichaceae bacterium]